MRIRIFAPLAALSLLPACAATIPPVEVTRFHVNEAIAPGTIATAPIAGQDGGTIEFRTYAIAVSRELAKLGFAEGQKSAYLVEIGYSRDTRAQLAKRSPVTIGIGGGSFGSHVGVGVGTSFGMGGGGSRNIVISRLEVRIKRKTDSAVVWEGRAQTEAPSNAPAAQPGLAAEKLATALFSGFPGESGKTISVP